MDVVTNLYMLPDAEATEEDEKFAFAWRSTTHSELKADEEISAFDVLIITDVPIPEEACTLIVAGFKTEQTLTIEEEAEKLADLFSSASNTASKEDCATKLDPALHMRNPIIFAPELELSALAACVMRKPFAVIELDDVSSDAPLNAISDA